MENWFVDARAFREWLLGILLLINPLIFAALIVLFWPVPAGDTVASLSGATLPIQVYFLLIVMIAGALGGSLNSARNYAVFKGSGKYTGTWTWWYIMNPVVGMGLGLLLYLVLQAGLFSASLQNSDAALKNANPAGFAAFAALAGMFAKKAIDKLEEIFDTILKSQEKPPGTYPPVIEKIEPAEKTVGAADLKIVVSGRNFDSRATVTVSGNARNVARGADGRLTVTLEVADLAQAGNLSVVVVNPAERGGSSRPATLAVKAP